MPSPRDPWLAANLSWSFAGLGQFYAGRKRTGIVFAALEILLWALWLACLFGARLSTLVLAGTIVEMLGLWMLSSFLAYRAIRRDAPAPPAEPRTPGSRCS